MSTSIYKTLFETQENKLKTGIIGMIFITGMLAGVFYYEANAIKTKDLDELQGLVDDGAKPKGVIKEMLGRESFPDGYTSENSETENTLTIENEMLFEVSCSLTWTDEDSNYPGGTNDPDEFKVLIQAPNGEVLDESAFSDTGSVSATA